VKPGRSIYKIDQEIERVWEVIEAASEETGEIPPDLDAMLDKLEGEKEVKIQKMLDWRADLLGDIEGHKLEEKRIATQRKLLESTVKSLVRNVGKQVVEEQELCVGTYVVKWQPSTAVVFTDESKIPEDFVKYERAPRKGDIRKAMMSGETVPGCEFDEPKLKIK